MIVLRRPRNVDSPRAAAILYGDWGTSKAYVTGIAFALAGYSSFYLILGMAVLTAIVGVNYIWICKHYPDGGGVYSSVRHRSKMLAVIGALLLVADYTITAAISAVDGFHYLGVAHPAWFAIGTIALIGLINLAGPRHSGEMAAFLALPAVLVVVTLVGASIPHLGEVHILPLEGGPFDTWRRFVGIILALSGVEAIANMTGVMKLDPGSTDDTPSVAITARRAIIPVMLEVTVFAAILGLAMHAIPGITGHTEDMLKVIGEHFVGRWFAPIVSVVFAFLLLSAANTALIDMTAILYLMSRDGEMPKAFSRLNRFGVPVLPLIVATVIPVLVTLIQHDVARLAGFYAIGVIGAITINIGSCATNRQLTLTRIERPVMMATFIMMALVELTIAYEKHDALIFAVSIMVSGLVVREVAQRFERRPEAQLVQPAAQPMATFAEKMRGRTSSILVAVRGVTDTLRFSIEEARLRNAVLYVLFVREIVVPTVTDGTWTQDDVAQEVFRVAQEMSNDVPVVPLYCVGDDPSSIILDQAATLGVDYLILGASVRGALMKILRGSVIQQVADQLPEEIKLLIYG
jgi:amino acid transporter/nucleotide-binding universal stress UspA family protein